jgi:hypothetical protein
MWSLQKAAAPPEEAGSGSGGGGKRDASASAVPAASAASGPAAEGAPPPPEENPWEVNKPVERRSQQLNEEAHDCLYCFWSWITCGGPGARVRQLYVNGKLSRCMDDYVRLKNCLIFKMDPEQDINVIPGPHPVWRIRTRKQAAQFWQVRLRRCSARPPPRRLGPRRGLNRQRW